MRLSADPTSDTASWASGTSIPSSAGTTLIVGSPGTPSSTTANAGRVYAFHGQSGTGGVITLGSADAVIAGPASPARIGFVLANLGPLGGALPAVGIGNAGDLLDVPGANGTAFVTSGTAATGPFASKTVVYMSGRGFGGWWHPAWWRPLGAGHEPLPHRELISRPSGRLVDGQHGVDHLRRREVGE